MAEFSVSCAKCNRRVSTAQVRVQPGGKYICFDCAKYSPASSGVSGRSSQSEEHAASDPVKSKTRYQCAKCKYEFWLKDGHAKKCPYCNGERIEEKQGAAQKLIDLHMPMRGDD